VYSIFEYFWKEKKQNDFGNLKFSWLSTFKFSWLSTFKFRNTKKKKSSFFFFVAVFAIKDVKGIFWSHLYYYLKHMICCVPIFKKQTNMSNKLFFASSSFVVLLKTKCSQLLFVLFSNLNAFSWLNKVSKKKNMCVLFCQTKDLKKKRLP